MKYYVYVYLDPRKPGSFDYGEFHFDYEPFYVGKGSGSQCQLHLGWAQNTTYNSYKLNKIRKIQSLGLEPKIIKYKENLTEEEAFDLEKKLIKTIGRIDLKQGPLTNLTDGGEGISNPSKETRQKQGEKKRGKISWNKGLIAEINQGVARQAEKMRGRTKEIDPSVASQAEKLRGRTAETDPGYARSAEKRRGRTAVTHLYLARIAEKKRGRKRGTKEDTPWIARMAEKRTGRTAVTHPGVARQAEKMKVIMLGNKNAKRKD